ncbi:Hypothetical predicted protein [Pelobates cultripes]|uniref:Uncharacterized protein n=1 Tax=Pelobates cultripes TaxID=61616 RepID=A0AAD1RH55_PELCU|nr:Hypothetical predicted protein [Pelobates cultripes]
MDGFLQPPRGNGGGNESPPPAAQHSAQAPRGDPTAIERIGEELRNIAAAMATKADLLTLTTTIQDALRAEMAGLRTEVTTQAGRIQALEQTAETHSTRINATDVAIASLPTGYWTPLGQSKGNKEQPADGESDHRPDLHHGDAWGEENRPSEYSTSCRRPAPGST